MLRSNMEQLSQDQIVCVCVVIGVGARFLFRLGVYIHTQTYTHPDIHTSRHTPPNTHIHIHNTYPDIHTHIDIQIHRHTYTPTHIDIYTQTYTHTLVFPARQLLRFGIFPTAWEHSPFYCPAWEHFSHLQSQGLSLTQCSIWAGVHLATENIGDTAASKLRSEGQGQTELVLALRSVSTIHHTTSCFQNDKNSDCV